MVEDEGGVAQLISGQPHVNGGKVTGGEFSVGPSEHDALVLDQVQEISRVILVAEREGTSFMGLDERILSRKGHMGILIKKSVKDFGWCSGKFNDLVDVLRLEFHVNSR